MATKSKQRKLENFFDATSPLTTKSLVNPIIQDIISAVFKSKRTHVNVNKSTLENWQKAYPWLKIIESNNEVRMTCSTCTKFKTGSVWANDGAANIQKSAIERHCASKDHIEAQKKDIKCSFDSNSEGDDDQECKKADISLFRSVYSLMKNEIPLNQLNAILELQRLNGTEMPYQNLSWTTIKEIQDIIADNYKKDLVNDINSSNFFALLLDESTDITVSKRLSICVRYVKAGQAITSFLASAEIPDGCAYTVVEAVHNIITSLGLDLKKCVSLATDGASVMMGRKTGVGVQLKSKFCPYMIQTHCIAHRFNFAITDAMKKNDVMKKFKEMFQSLYNFMSASTVRIKTLKAMQDILNEPEITIKEPHSIRWLGLKRSVEVVYDCFGSLLAALSNLATENPSAKGLFKYFSLYKTALLVGLMLDIHTELGILSCYLQERSLIFSDVYPLIESTVGKLEYMKSNEGNGLHEMRKNIKISENFEASYKGEILKNFKKDQSDKEFETVKLVYIDSLINNIKKRIRKNDSEVLASLGVLLEPSSYSSDYQSSLKCITNLYCEPKVTKKTVDDIVHETPVPALLDGVKLNEEWHGAKSMSQGCYKQLSLQEFCKKIILKHNSTCPNFAKLAEIGLCIEVSSVECERSFSAQNRLKTKYRAALKDESLEALMTVFLLGPPVLTYNPSKCVRKWLKRKDRRKKRLAEAYKPRTSVHTVTSTKKTVL